MSSATKRKHVTREVEQDFSLPEGGQTIVKVVAGRGNNLHEVQDHTGEAFLVSMPNKFRKNVWIKRGDFVVVNPIEEGDKVKAEICTILYKEQIKYIKAENLWPAGFVKSEEAAQDLSKLKIKEENSNSEEESDDESDLFQNTNRPVYEKSEDSESCEDDTDEKQSKSIQRFRQVAWPKAKAIVDSNPLLANALIYGGLYTMAEVSQQTRRNTVSRDTTTSLARDTTSMASKLDLSSVKRYAIMGTVCISPLMTKWYGWLDGKFPCTTTPVVIKKLFLDQFVFTPFVVVVFYVGMSYLEGKRGHEAFDELKEKGLQTFAMDCCFWLPASAINFIFVPAWLRVAFIGLSSFLWLNVLCWIKSWPTSSSVTCCNGSVHHSSTKSKCDLCS